MHNSKLTATPFHLILAVLYMLCILSISVTFVLNFRPLYYFDIGHLHISENSGYPEDEIRENYDALIDYNSPFYKEDLSFPTLPMSENGHTHFVEVKRIFVFVQYLAVVSLILCIALTFFQVRKRKFLFLKYAGILTLVVPAVFGCLIAVNWDAFFVTFHHLFFNNDYWIFDAASDPVILILPDTFFMHAAILILGCVILGSILCLTIGWKLERSCLGSDKKQAPL